MCSIFGIIGAPPEGNFRKIAVRQSNLLVHRGPDSCGISKIGDCYIAHNRISIVDVFTGGQPIWHPDGKSAVVANAEIYNHAALREEFPHYPFQTRSDCEFILPLVNSGAAENLNKLRGMFAFIAVQDGGKRYCIARDHMGILSLYYGYDARGVLYVASEMKALVESGGQPLSCEHAANKGSFPVSVDLQRPVPPRRRRQLRAVGKVCGKRNEGGGSLAGHGCSPRSVGSFGEDGPQISRGWVSAKTFVARPGRMPRLFQIPCGWENAEVSDALEVSETG